MAMLNSSRAGENDEVSLVGALLRRLDIQDQKITDLVAELDMLKTKADENAVVLTAMAEMWTQMAGMALRLRSTVRRT